MTVHGYQWETEDGSGTAVVPDAQRQPSLEERVAALEQWTEQDAAVDTLTLHRITALEVQTKGHSDLLHRIQDANLAPMLESSAVIVELRRIADAMTTLASCVSRPEDGTRKLHVGDVWRV